MSSKKRSLIVGLLYVSLVFLGPIGFLMLPEQFNVENVNVFTSNNIGLLGVWILVEILIIAVEIVLSIYLFRLLEKYHKRLSISVMVFRLIVVGVMVLNGVFLTIVLLSNGSNADVYIPLHANIVYVWQMFFSVHIVLLGVLVFKYLQSKWRYLGIALLIGSIGYVLDSIMNLLNLNNEYLSMITIILLVFITIGEIGMALGLIMNKIVEVE